MSHVALRDFQYRDLERGVDVKVKAGEAVGERVLNMHRDPGALVRNKFITGNDVRAESERPASVEPKKRRSKKAA